MCGVVRFETFFEPSIRWADMSPMVHSAAVVAICVCRGLLSNSCQSPRVVSLQPTSITDDEQESIALCWKT